MKDKGVQQRTGGHYQEIHQQQDREQGQDKESLQRHVLKQHINTK